MSGVEVMSVASRASNASKVIGCVLLWGYKLFPLLGSNRVESIGEVIGHLEDLIALDDKDANP
jgi:hypothetical protein